MCACGRNRLRAARTGWPQPAADVAWAAQAVYFTSNLTQLSGLRQDDPMASVLTNRLAYFMNTALDTVKQDFPYWNRSNGADHFWCASHGGRGGACGAACLPSPTAPVAQQLRGFVAQDANGRLGALHGRAGRLCGHWEHVLGGHHGGAGLPLHHAPARDHARPSGLPGTASATARAP